MTCVWCERAADARSTNRVDLGPLAVVGREGPAGAVVVARDHVPSLAALPQARMAEALAALTALAAGVRAATGAEVRVAPWGSDVGHVRFVLQPEPAEGPRPRSDSDRATPWDVDLLSVARGLAAPDRGTPRLSG